MLAVLVFTLVLLAFSPTAMGAEVISFIEPPLPITDLSGILLSGGSLTDGVTYYYTVLSNGDGTRPGGCASAWYGDGCTRSGKSNEVSFTANSTHKTINLTWSVMGNATSYLVFRTTLQGRYDTINTRMASETTGSHWNPSTLDNNFSDDGTHTMRGAYTPVFNKPAAMYAGGLNLSANGTGCLNLSSSTDITLKEIYDASVTDGWSDWCHFDGGHFVLAGDFPTMPQEYHFQCLGEVMTIYGWGRFKGVSDSEIKFGQIDANGFTTSGCTINMLGGGGGATQVDFDADTLIYDTNAIGASGTSNYYGGTYIHGGQYVNLNAGIQKDLKMQYYTTLFLRNDYALNGLEITSYLASVYNDLTLTQNIKTSSYHWMYYSSISRLDKFTATNANYQTYVYYSLGVPKHAVYVDPSFPNTKDTDGLPQNYWVGGHGQHTEVWHSFKLQTIDDNGGSISDANITIYQVNGSIARDFDGTQISDFQTDSNGGLWREKINITAATAATITDSSKSWTSNEWKARNTYIIDGSGARQEVKVLSNTADTLTFTESFATTPSAGDQAGIIIEMQRVKMEHNSGSAASCYTPIDTCTNKTFLSPYNITIDATNYIDKKVVYDLTKPLDIVVTLEQPPTVIDGTLIINSADDTLLIRKCADFPAFFVILLAVGFLTRRYVRCKSCGKNPFR